MREVQPYQTFHYSKEIHEMKVNKKYLDKVAVEAGGMVMAEKKSGGVTRREQVALAHGIAAGMFFVTAGLADESMTPREAAARLINACMESLPAHRDEMLSKGVADAKCVVVVGER